jgi:hypothetical protein
VGFSKDSKLHIELDWQSRCNMGEHDGWKKKMRSLSNKITFDQLCKMFDVETMDDFQERLLEYDWFHCDVDGCEHESETSCPGLRGEQEAQDEAIKNYLQAVIAVAEKLFGEHDLLIVPDGNALEYKIVPKTSWKVSADKIRETINGVGYFSFSSVKEFCDSGPYTPRQAVLSHLGWISDWGAVYGDGSAKSMVERRMR